MFLRDLSNQVTNVNNLIRVQPIRRLIQHHKTWIMNDGLCDAYPLLISTRKILDQTITKMRDRTTLQGYINSLIHFRFIHQAQKSRIP